MGWMSQPQAPDPMETATAQAGMNRDTAITQQQLNMVNQNTPTGSLSYAQTGQAFSPSETGQTLYYNPATDEYRSSAPTVTTTIGGTSGSTGPRHQDFVSGDWLDAQGRPWVDGTKPTTKDQLEQGWQQVKGNLTPQYTATTTLSPGQQDIFDKTQSATSNLAGIADDRSKFLADYLSKNIDLSGAPALNSSIGGGFSGLVGGSYSDRLGGNYSTDLGDGYNTSVGDGYQTSYADPNDFSADRQRTVDDIKARAAPDMQAQQKSLETQLINKGLRPGTPQWNSELDRLGRANNDFNIAADLAGGTEQSRLVNLSKDAAGFTNNALLSKGAFENQSMLDKANFGNQSELAKFTAQNGAALSAADMRNNAAATQATFGNNARTQYMNEAYAERNQPLQEIISLLGASPVQNPNFTNTPQAQVGGVDYSGLVSDKYKADVAASSSAMGGLFGLLGTGLTAGLKYSDRRLKTDIRRVGALDNGLPVYAYRFHGSDVTEIGVMADEVETINPAAVTELPNGIKMVDYGMATEAA